jgi:hypothetical protein
LKFKAYIIAFHIAAIQGWWMNRTGIDLVS